MTIYNFSAGPAMLPKSVLEKIQNEMLSLQGSGMSILEISHRSQMFQNILNEAKQNLKELLHVPDNYHILFMQGGGTSQFSTIPLNLANYHYKVAMLNSGHWSDNAAKEVENLGYGIDIVGDTKDFNYQRLPFPSDRLSSIVDDYLYVTINNTIEGTAYHADNLPKHDGMPLVGDMSSNFMAERYNIEDFGLIFAGAQKNVGPAGVTIIIVRDDLVKPAKHTPKILNYEPYIEKNSAFNTPPVFAIYAVDLVSKWLKEQGGIDAIEKINRKKANLLYHFIDKSHLFRNNVSEKERSLTNITFTTGDNYLDDQLIQEASDKGIKNIRGHRSIGGLRASIYNAMPIEGVQKLVDCLIDFEANNHY